VAAFSRAPSVWPLKDGRRRPVFHRLEDGFNALIEAQQACGEVVRRRCRSCIIAGDVEAARVFHRRSP
jgi:hypothetical protein